MAGVSSSFSLGAISALWLPSKGNCNCMVALKGPVVTELTTIIYANAERASL